MIRKKSVCKFIYLSSSVDLAAECGGGSRRAVHLGGSEDVGGGGGVWDSWDDAGLGAAAVGDGGGLESGESVGLCATRDGGTGSTAGDGGCVHNGRGCVGCSGRPNGDGVVSSPGICNTGGGSEKENCGLHFDFGFFGFWSLVWKGRNELGIINGILEVVKSGESD